MLIGVLALQGDVSEHFNILRNLLAAEEVTLVKTKERISELDGLIIPGGESTTVGKLMVKYGIDKKIKSSENLAIFGTCTGAILLAKKILGMKQFTLNLMDFEVERNAYGRQRESFEADLAIPVLDGKPFRGIFIRAPVIKNVGKKVKVLARYKNDPVLIEEDRFLAATFHPELTGYINTS
jgi:5'-phosphate synthase pdxT subunit